MTHALELGLDTFGDVTMDADGTAEIILSPNEHPQPWIKLEPDAVCAITRDYLIEPDTSRRMEWHIECLDGLPAAIARLREMA